MPFLSEGSRIRVVEALAYLQKHIDVPLQAFLDDLTSTNPAGSPSVPCPADERLELPTCREIKGYVADYREFLHEGTIPERQALIRNFAASIEIDLAPGNRC